jgi:two-component system chemotaxis response regulator CheY
MPEKDVILIADDSSSVRKFVSFSLKSMGFEVVAAEDGMDALEKMPQYDVKLVITDLNMPNVDGLELIRTIRANEAYKDIPIIVLSSIQDESDKKKCFDAGANAYLVKPFNAKRLQYELSKFLTVKK